MSWFVLVLSCLLSSSVTPSAAQQLPRPRVLGKLFFDRVPAALHVRRGMRDTRHRTSELANDEGGWVEALPVAEVVAILRAQGGTLTR